MSETGEAEDACASRAKPRLEERVCERGWRPTLDVVTGAVAKEGAPKGASSRDCARGRHADRSNAYTLHGGRMSEA
jgi:hypothetical protein